MTKREYDRLWRAKNKDKISAYNKRYNLEHKEQIRANYEKNKETISRYYKKLYLAKRDEILKRTSEYNRKNSKKISSYLVEYRKRNSKKRADYNKAWKKENPHLVSLSNLKFHYKRSKRIRNLSAEETNAIKQFYANCPEGYVVDHIVPLLGKTVKGWHELKNLQYLTISENLKKGNKFPYYPLDFYKKRGLIQE